MVVEKEGDKRNTVKKQNKYRHKKDNPNLTMNYEIKKK